MVHKTEHLRGAVWQDRFHGHSFAAKMHVRLEVLEDRRMFQHVEPFRLLHGIRRNIQLKLAIDRRVCRVRHQIGSIFRLLAFRIEINGQLRMISDLFTYGMKMQFPPDMRTGHQ